MIRLRVVAPALATLVACAAPHHGVGAQLASAPAARALRGLVVPPDGGERLPYCARPLLLTVKVDSIVAPGTRVVAGTADLRGDEGLGRHGDADEVLYVARGWGHAIVGPDTVRLGPGSFVHVPPGLAHHLVSTGPEPMHYFFVLAPRASAASFRRAAAVGCHLGGAAPTAAAASPPASPSQSGRVTAFDPGAGDRITYCLFPLTITTKIDSGSAPGTRLTAAAGSLRRGAEVGVHPVGDEVAFFTSGRGRAFIGADTVDVRAGAVTFVPEGMQHGFVNESDEPLEYVVVYQRGFSTAGFRRLAARPGPYCPSMTR